MLDKNRDVIYIGKANNLKKRIANYFTQSKDANIKKVKLVSKIRDIKTISTYDENEALILEAKLIKKYSPKYNIIFRDDRNYVGIVISRDAFPRIFLCKKYKKNMGEYFGPYSNREVAYEAINIIHKIFQLRNCLNSAFKNRSRYCLQYQIKRCLAPCVKLTNEKRYREKVNHARLFLLGKSSFIIKKLEKKMQTVSEKLDYETALTIREQIKKLQKAQKQQMIFSNTIIDCDIIVTLIYKNSACLLVYLIRGGIFLEQRSFFPTINLNFPKEKIMQAFLMQYYMVRDNQIPKKILIETAIDLDLYSEILSKKVKKKVKIIIPKRGEKLKWINRVKLKAEKEFKNYLSSFKINEKQFKKFMEIFNITKRDFRIEAFDISHTGGKNCVASCIVFNGKNFLKHDYHRFNLSVQDGDDLKAMAEVITRRFEKSKEEKNKIPELIIIDGGREQLKIVINILAKDNISFIVPISIAKNRTDSNYDKVYWAKKNGEIVKLNLTKNQLLIIQKIRDEAHRFALSNHRIRNNREFCKFE